MSTGTLVGCHCPPPPVPFHCTRDPSSCTASSRVRSSDTEAFSAWRASIWSLRHRSRSLHSRKNASFPGDQGRPDESSARRPTRFATSTSFSTEHPRKATWLRCASASCSEKERSAVMSSTMSSRPSCSPASLASLSAANVLALLAIPFASCCKSITTSRRLSSWVLRHAESAWAAPWLVSKAATLFVSWMTGWSPTWAVPKEATSRARSLWSTVVFQPCTSSSCRCKSAACNVTASTLCCASCTFKSVALHVHFSLKSSIHSTHCRPTSCLTLRSSSSSARDLVAASMVAASRASRASFRTLSTASEGSSVRKAAIRLQTTPA
mmetsp:Transcript_48229/g.104931  ORF Transcript_48229/g.104931 Transcript_48229/m.104931 type:complete len:324 (+) Transcript_48229:123-1094(+)